jgi:hypothetical protein
MSGPARCGLSRWAETSGWCLVDFETGPTFDSFMGLKFFLEDQLGQKVDLVKPTEGTEGPSSTSLANAARHAITLAEPRAIS